MNTPAEISQIEQYYQLTRISKTIDAVLVSHAEMSHIGGYASAVSKFGLNCPCYATIPCHDMGLQLMRDYIKSKLQQSEWDELSLDDVENSFKKMNLLRYSQPFSLGGLI
jgi:cleavage and polyadenylation specificity factor subunit 2